MMKKIVYSLGLLSPMLALAENDPGSLETGIGSLGDSILNIINGTIIPILFAVAIVYFLYGLVKFIMSAGDEKKRSESKGIMIWGIVGLVIMASVYGLINFFQKSVGIDGGGSITLPEVPKN